MTKTTCADCGETFKSMKKAMKEMSKCDYCRIKCDSNKKVI